MRGGVFALLHRGLCFYKRHKGGILIEFTFSIPVCIILLFFVNDHYRIYELKNKLKSSAYLAASMVQQLGNTRTNKQLTHKDLARISYASCLNLFHTNSMFSPYPLGIYFAIDYDWVKKIEANKYQHKQCWGTTSGTSPQNMSNSSGNAISTKTEEKIEAIHSDLVCNGIGEEKLLISCYYRKVGGSFNKSKLGLFIMDPQFGAYDFKYKIIITPKPGLFPVVD